MSRRVRIATRLSGIKPSGIRRLFDLAQGDPDVISLGVGEPDFVSPSHVLEAAKQAMDEGKTHYTPNAGILELREGLAKKAKKDYGLLYDPQSEVLVTAGGTEAIFLALTALINPGDEVLVPNPGFVCYEPNILMAGGVPVSMPLCEENSFRLNANVVTSLITDRSRVMILNFPNNPTGSVLSYDSIAGLAKLAVERDLIVISDEVYEKILYDNVKHHCLATFRGMRDRTIVVNSFSKTYAMTGFRVGYALGPKELIASMLKCHQYVAACTNAPAQYAAVAALEGPQTFTENMVQEFDRRRHLLHSRLDEIEGFQCLLPQGAFYAFANVKEFGLSSEKFADYLFDKEKVVTVAGSSFGEHGEGYLRFSYATAYDKVREALDRIENAVKTFN
ncbi:MAG: pyridoxal phosphate-dependent aminotransferase [Candidatus Bathyarchaeota archaeon]|nr:pyridoxal phosphate-dependent aminotransferase [Candidatus Bathyarchaeota archaeon]MDH5732682.1 pyridoxal phosphate-dependent aminotransferase [Candidatus Bathyarchaeota archaeon]